MRVTLFGWSSLVVVAVAPGQSGAQGNAPLIGRWDLTIQSDTLRFPGWLELCAQGQGGLGGRLQWGWGHATPVTEVRLSGRSFWFSWPDEADSAAAPARASGQLRSGRLTAILNGSDGRRYQIRGRRAPPLTRTPSDTAGWGREIVLLAPGLSQWTARGAQNGWSIEGGVLRNQPPSSDLISKLPLGDFKLHVEVNVPPGGNSGIYLRGRYEIQVLDSYGKPVGSREMGGIYGQVTPASNAARPAGEWQSFDITLVGRRVKVMLNGVTIHDFAEIPGITGGALDSEEAKPGPLLLQGDHSAVRYRNLVVRPALPANPARRHGVAQRLSGTASSRPSLTAR